MRTSLRCAAMLILLIGVASVLGRPITALATPPSTATGATCPPGSSPSVGGSCVVSDCIDPVTHQLVACSSLSPRAPATAADPPARSAPAPAPIPPRSPSRGGTSSRALAVAPGTGGGASMSSPWAPPGGWMLWLALLAAALVAMTGGGAGAAVTRLRRRSR